MDLQSGLSGPAASERPGLGLVGRAGSGLSLPNTAGTQQMFSAVVAAGGADLDHSALVMATERLAGVTLDHKTEM